MDDLRNQVETMRRRLRLQSLVSVGVLIVLMFAMGGADTIARTLVESDAWRVKTKKGDLVNYADRILVTTDIDKAQVKINDANLVITGTGATTTGNIVLAQQTATPSSPVAGTLWYDSNTGVNKLKYYNGTAWVDASGSGGGGGSAGEETWRLEYTSSTTLTLRGTGNGSGLIDINGTLRSFASNPTLGAQSGTALYWIYASWNGSAVVLEASSATAPITAQYGVYSTKTGDATRRFVGMVYTTSSTYTFDLVRSVKNERGYGHLYKHAPATALNQSTTNTTWTDFDPVIIRNGLFFDQDRIRAWASVMVYHPGQWVGRDCRLGVSVGGIACDDSEVGGSVASGGYWAAAYVPFRAEGYVTVSGAGLKSIKPLQRTPSGGTAQWYIITQYPASVGFEVLR
jgi:hypothetical protein